METILNAVKATGVTVPSVESLRNAGRFSVGKKGLLFKHGSRGESGLLFTFRLLDYNRLPEEGDSKYRADAKLEVTVEGQKKRVIPVSLSGLLVYKIEQDPEKYLNVSFTSYSTTPDYDVNPLYLITLKDGRHFVTTVDDGGKESYQVALPFGGMTDGERFKKSWPENYYRYYNSML